MFVAEPFWKAISDERSVVWLQLSSYAEVWNTQLTRSFVQSAVRRFLRSLSDVSGHDYARFKFLQVLTDWRKNCDLFSDPKSKNAPYEENSLCSFSGVLLHVCENILRLEDFLMSDYALLVTDYTLLNCELLFGFLVWEYLFSWCQPITNNSTFKQFKTLSKCFRETAPNRILS